jgi:hypothetical protein
MLRSVPWESEQMSKQDRSLSRVVEQTTKQRVLSNSSLHMPSLCVSFTSRHSNVCTLGSLRVHTHHPVRLLRGRQHTSSSYLLDGDDTCTVRKQLHCRPPANMAGKRRPRKKERKPFPILQLPREMRDKVSSKMRNPPRRSSTLNISRQYNTDTL